MFTAIMTLNTVINLSKTVVLSVKMRIIILLLFRFKKLEIMQLMKCLISIKGDTLKC